MKNNIENIINRAKSAAAELLNLTGRQRKAVLADLSQAIIRNKQKIIKANVKDARSSRKQGKSDSFIERLTLNHSTIKYLADSLKRISNRPEVLFKVLKQYRQPSGIIIKKVSYPLGLIAIIYESRPNVTIDAFALAFKSGNAVILKGGREIAQTNKILVSLIKQVLEKHKINTDIVFDLSDTEQSLAEKIITNQKIDCLIPRGGRGLIDFIKEKATIPVIITGASVVHTYVDRSADLKLARRVILNAKTRRVSICNALDVILLHKDIYQKFLSLIADDFAAKQVEIRADNKVDAVLKKLKYQKLKKADQNDFDTEFLDYIVAVKVVNDFKQALEHIKRHSLGHSEAIITQSKKQAQKFFKQIDAACLYLNTSTQFSDGGEYGLGGEIGISTQKLHARGPFAYEELTTYKYLVESRGATRK